MPDYWIQIENRLWDVCPHNIDRMTGQNLKDLEGTDPVTVTLSSPGTGVVRNNVTMDNHSTTSDTGVWDSGVHNTGFNFSHTFASPGSFPYHCSIHGGVGGVGMSGTVTVT